MKKLKERLTHEEKELTQQEIAKIINKGRESGSMHLTGSREEMIEQFRKLAKNADKNNIK